MTKKGVVREIISVLIGWTFGFATLLSGFYALVQLGHASTGVTCKCNCKNGTGKNLVLAPDFMESDRKCAESTADSATEGEVTDHSDEPLEYEPVVEEESLLDVRNRPEETNAGATYKAGKELHVAPGAITPAPAYDRDQMSVAPEIPETAPLLP